jgi:cytochrome oxidase assembly protein ShyY1
VLRWPESRRAFSPKDDPDRNIWFVRDPVAIAAAKSWGEVAPFFVELESPQPSGGLPRPGALKVNLRNEHLQYAITWYGLALVVVVMFGFWFGGRAAPRHEPRACALLVEGAPSDYVLRSLLLRTLIVLGTEVNSKGYVVCSLGE